MRSEIELENKLDLNMGTLVVTDPCYIKDGEPYGFSYQKLIHELKVEKGMYDVSYKTEHDAFGSNHKRLASVKISHEGLFGITDDIEHIGEVCVDSGGIIMGSTGHILGQVDYHGYIPYEQAGAARYNSEGDSQVGFVDSKTISMPSGYGDGCYGLYVGKNDDGVINVVEIYFVEED